MRNGRVDIIPNDQGNRITPSYMAFTEEGERLVGDAAKNQLTTNPKNTIFDAKRLIGRDWGDAAVQSDIKYFPFKTYQKKGKSKVTRDIGGCAIRPILITLYLKMKYAQKLAIVILELSQEGNLST